MGQLWCGQLHLVTSVSANPQSRCSDVRAWFLAGLAGFPALFLARSMGTDTSASRLTAVGAFMRRAIATILGTWMLAEKYAPTAMRDVPGSSYVVLPIDLVVQLLAVVAPTDAKMTARSGLVAGLLTDEVLRPHRARHEGRVFAMRELLPDLNLATHFREVVELMATLRISACTSRSDFFSPVDLRHDVPTWK